METHSERKNIFLIAIKSFLKDPWSYLPARCFLINEKTDKTS